MSLNLKSSGGGSVTVDVPSTASNYTATLPAGTGNVVVNGINGALVSGTAQASTSGTSIDFTGIPSWVKRITVMFSGVSTNGTATPWLIQLGTSSGIEATGYLGSGTALAAGASSVNSTTGIPINVNNSAANIVHGSVVITLLNSSTNLWTAFGVIGQSNQAYTATIGSSKSLASTLDRVRITSNGTDTFDAGSINILYE